MTEQSDKRQERSREFWSLLHEWRDATSDERADAIEHRLNEMLGLAALAGPLEQPQEPTSDKANLAQASGVCDLQTALPKA